MIKKQRVVIYCRVSSDEQRSNTSLASQQQACEQYAAKNNMVVDQIFTEDHSGKTFDRPIWKLMLKYLKRNSKYIDLLLFYDWSRFGRDTAGGFFWHQHLMKDLHITPQSITQHINYDTPEYVYQLSIFLSGPQVENTWRSIKTSNGMIARMKQGTYIAGKLPIGYKKDQNTGQVMHSEHAALIRIAFDMILTGHNVAQVQQRMKAMGLSRPVQSWHKTLRQTYYKGMISHALLDEPVPASNMEPIVPALIYNKVQAILEGRHNPHEAHENNYPLRAFCRCGSCGGEMSAYTVNKKRLKSGTDIMKLTPQHYYICNNRACRTNYSLKNMHADFTALLAQYSIDPELVPIATDMLTDQLMALTEATRNENRAIQAKLTATTRRLESLHIKYIDGDLSAEEYHQVKAKLTAEQRLCEMQLTPVFDVSNPSMMAKKAVKYLSEMAETWAESGNDYKIKMQNVLFPQGIVYLKEKREYRTPAINRILTLKSAHIAFKSKKAKTFEAENFGLINCGSPQLMSIEPLIKDLQAFIRLTA